MRFVSQRPDQVFGGIHDSFLAKSGNELASLCLQPKKPAAADQEYPPLLAIGPGGNAAMCAKPYARRALSPLIETWVISPQLLSVVSVQRHHASESGGKVQHVVDHQRSCFDTATAHAVL